MGNLIGGIVLGLLVGFALARLFPALLSKKNQGPGGKSGAGPATKQV